MMIRVSIPLAKDANTVGIVELSTETTGENITIRIGDVSATVNRLDLQDAVCTRCAPAFVPFEPPMMGGPIVGVRPYRG